MKSKILIDSNVLIDIYSRDEHWSAWSAEMISKYFNTHDLVINPIIYAEISYTFKEIYELEASLSNTKLVKDDLPRETSELIVEAMFSYRKNGGIKKVILPDLLIGAHAQCKKMKLLTRDVRRYRTYFPQISLISPS